MNPHIAKQAAELLAKAVDENTKLAEENASLKETLATKARSEDSLKLALRIAEKEGITDLATVMEKAAKIRDSGKDLRIIEAAIEFTTTDNMDLALGKVASRPGSTGGVTPEQQFMQDLLTPESEG